MRSPAAALAVLALAPAAAQAAPPPNDNPATPGAFAAYAAQNGVPREQQAVAELREATPDGGVPRCLGADSFARTVWYRIPTAEVPRELTVEAIGRTTAVVDLAAFVQPEGATGPSAGEPQACAGAGSGGAEESEEPASAISLRIPARRAVLVQVGRRGPVASSDDERAVVTLSETPLPATPAPAGDKAFESPFAPGNGATTFLLGGATLTEEDPAQPPCPSLASVWRRITPGKGGRRIVSADGRHVSTLTTFAGRRPTADNVHDCVNREQRGDLELRIPTRRGRNVWIRVGTDRPVSTSEAELRIRTGRGETVVDGGPGGSDPTPGGPGGGLPETCDRTRAARVRITGTIAGTAKRRNRRPAFPLALRLRRGSVCDVDLQLRGPRGRIYATAKAIRLAGRTRVKLQRARTLARGRYRLVVTALGPVGERRRVKSTVRGRLR